MEALELFHYFTILRTLRSYKEVFKVYKSKVTFLLCGKTFDKY